MMLLKNDDLFLLEDGMRVYAMIPEKYIYTNRNFSETLTSHEVDVGIVYTNEEITKRNIKEEANHIANEIFRLFQYKSFIVDFSVCDEFVKANIDVDAKIALSTFKFKGGIFKVVYTTMEGGSSIGYDYYPNGWYVKAIRMIDGIPSTDEKDKISFYQSGCFTAMIEDVKIIKT